MIDTDSSASPAREQPRHSFCARPSACFATAVSSASTQDPQPPSTTTTSLLATPIGREIFAHSRMELSNLLSGPVSSNAQNPPDNPASPHRTHSYPTRNTMTGMDMRTADNRMATPPAAYLRAQSNSTTPHNTSMSPFGSPTPKSVAFELLFPESPQYRARLPMRVQIFPHDTTDSIITTVKNFYGLYAGPGGAKGVSFEDEQGNTLIARYENLRNNMIVYVRVIDEPSPPPGAYDPSSYHSGSPVMQPAYYPGEGHHMPPPQPAQVLSYGQPLSRPTSRTSRKRSMSPNSGRGRRSASVSTNPPQMKKSRSRSGFESRGSSAHGSFADGHSDAMNGYSSGDGAPGSVSSRTKSEHIGNTEISLDNIVEGGRRKRAKFESSVSSFIDSSNDHGSATDSFFLRSCHCSLHLRCLQRLRILPSRPLVAWSITGDHCHSEILPNILSRILSPCHPHKALAMDMDSQVSIPHLRRVVVALEVVHHILQDVPQLGPHPMTTILEYFLHPTQLLAVACRRKTRMWLFS